MTFIKKKNKLIKLKKTKKSYQNKSKLSKMNKSKLLMRSIKGKNKFKTSMKRFKKNKRDLSTFNRKNQRKEIK